MTKEKKEHVAIITTNVAIFTRDAKGNLHGPVMNQEEMKEVEVEHQQRFTISGFDRFECIKKTKESIDAIRKKSEAS